MSAFRKRCRLHLDDAVDAEHPDGGARDLSPSRLQARGGRTAPFVRRRSHRRDLGARSLSGAPDRARLAILAAAATGIQVGAAITATRFAVDMVGPASLAFLRYAIGAACLAPVFFSRDMRFERADIVPIALLGIGQFGVLIALLNYGLKSVPSARAALIFASFPMLTLLFAALVGQERLTAAKVAGVALTILGVGFALGDRTMGGGSWAGELAVLAAAATGAVCSVLYRPYLKRYPTLPVSAFAMLAAVVALALPAALDDLGGAVWRLTPAGWAAVVFIG